MNTSWTGRCLIGEMFDKHIADEKFNDIEDIERDGHIYRVRAQKHPFFGEKYNMAGDYSVDGEGYIYHFRYDGDGKKLFDDNYLVYTGPEEIE